MLLNCGLHVLLYIRAVFPLMSCDGFAAYFRAQLCFQHLCSTQVYKRRLFCLAAAAGGINHGLQLTVESRYATDMGKRKE
jgi:hypothetical protein